MLQTGDEAPDFSLESDEGETVTLSALRGQPVVFYFYPKDDTPGCTAQACSLRDSYGDILASGAALYGISPGRLASRIAHSAPSTPCRSRCWSTPAMRSPRSTAPGASGRTAQMGILRSAFVVGADGRHRCARPTT